MSEVVIERLGAKDYEPQQGLVYVDIFKLHQLYNQIAFEANLILEGPKGVAKTLSVAAWAAKNKHPLVTVDCSEDIRRPHLVGMFTLRGDESPFILGPIPTAVDIANEVGSCVLCFEEINALVPQMQKVLNSIGDYRRRVEVPECGRIYRLRPGAKLWVTATMNTSVYGGVYSLNEDLKSRFRMIPLDYPTKGPESRVIKRLAPPECDPKIVEQMRHLAHETRQRSLAYALSTRDLIQLLEDVPRCGLKSALWMASGKFEGQDRDYFKTRVSSIFGIKLK